MIITKVIIDNFKIYQHQEFEFGDSKAVLLTGANGFGKTTLFDAIEWCLTGNISRLKKCYGERNTKQTEVERVENKKGIIRNSESSLQDLIKVTLILRIDDNQVEVFRQQMEDSLYVETELKYNGNVMPDIKSRINQYAANDRFYKYHVCDMYKSHNFLNSSRQEIKNEFDDFIRPYPLADRFSEKLAKLQDEIKVKIKELDNKKIQQVIIDNVKSELDSIKVGLKSIEYPQIKFYEEENLYIEKEQNEKVGEQLINIKKCGYNTVTSKIKDVILYYEAKEKANRLEELTKIIVILESDLYFAIKNSYYDIEKLEEIKNRIKEIADEKVAVVNAKKNSDFDISSKPQLYFEIADDIKTKVNKILELEAELQKKQDDIKYKEKGNEIITALSNLVVSREGIIKYRNEDIKECPLCGSDEKFSKISQSSELAVEAEAYLYKNNSNLASMKKCEQEIIESINNKFEQFKQYIVKHLEGKINIYEDEKTIFNDCYEKTKDFFDRLKKENILIDENCIENVKRKKDEIIHTLSNESIISSYIDIIKDILIVLEYKCDFENITLESLKKIQLDMKQFLDESLLLSNFSFEIFNQKILFINNILDNQKICEKELQLEKFNNLNKDIEAKVLKMLLCMSKAKKLHDDIEAKKTQIEKLEFDVIGPYLFEIFKKVIKHTIITKFKSKRDGSRIAGGATFSDQNDNNILNILSQGQIGVFMLAYFFANMFKRKDETQFKVYFVDDITSCMDDMNVLSFVEIIKYQLYKKDGVIDQIFFSTCNGDLEKLFAHKMESFDVKCINVKFNSYAKGDIYNNRNIIKTFGIN